MQEGSTIPLKTVFVEFPGDIIKNMTDTEMAEVSTQYSTQLYVVHFVLIE